jgi:hypothetical protein
MKRMTFKCFLNLVEEFVSASTKFFKFHFYSNSYFLFPYFYRYFVLFYIYCIYTPYIYNILMVKVNVCIFIEDMWVTVYYVQYIQPTRKTQILFTTHLLILYFQIFKKKKIFSFLTPEHSNFKNTHEWVLCVFFGTCVFTTDKNNNNLLQSLI